MMLWWWGLACTSPEPVAAGTSDAPVAPASILLPTDIVQVFEPVAEPKRWEPISVPEGPRESSGVQWTSITPNSRLGHDPVTGERGRVLKVRRPNRGGG